MNRLPPFVLTAGTSLRTLHCCKRCQGFSLVELIVAMTVLMIVIAVAAKLLSASERSSYLGLSHATGMSDATAALSVIRQDLARAVTDSTTMKYHIGPDRASCAPYGLRASEMCFVVLKDGDPLCPTNARPVCEVFYWVREASNTATRSYELVRAQSWITDTSASNNCFTSPTWFDNRPQDAEADVLVRNVSTFLISASFDGTSTDEVDEASALPDYLDIALETLDSRSAAQAASMNDADCKRFVDQKAVRHNTRAIFNTIKENGLDP